MCLIVIVFGDKTGLESELSLMSLDMVEGDYVSLLVVHRSLVDTLMFAVILRVVTGHHFKINFTQSVDILFLLLLC